MSGVVTLIFTIAAALCVGTDAAQFLRVGEVNASTLEADLLSELASAHRPTSKDDRLQNIVDALFQLYSAVPGEHDGTLNHHVVRYVLHRYFTAKHGWFIRGLEPDGDHRDDASEESHAMTDLQEWVPSYLQKFLEQLNNGKGMTLREVAVIAATLEDLIHKEAVQRLELAWKALGYSADTNLYSSQVRKVMETYMIIYDSGGNVTLDTPDDVEEQLQFYSANVKDWIFTQSWLRRVRIEVFPQRQMTLNFSQTSHLIEEIGEKYGAFNDDDCGKLKKELLDIESSTRVGRVRLSEFYKKGLYSNWEFSEKKEYLRSLGALDESDEKQPYVIVPNYLASRPNCLVCSNFYVVCCRNECEDLMTSIEAEVTNHTIAPEVLLRLVARLSSGTIRAPRKLSSILMDRLREVAIINGGKVPIHGRLFAQWMHHAFPRECPYPHEAGAASPQTPNEWMASAGHDSHTLTEAERWAHVENDACKDGKACGEDHDLPWTHAEELLHKRPVVKQRPWKAVIRKVAVFGVISSMTIWMVFSWRSLFGQEDMTKSFRVGMKSHYA